jgi:replication factor C large subunit
VTAAPPTGLLSERRRPLRLDRIVGQPRAVAELREWAQGWAPGAPLPRYRAALLEGRAGVGKTTAAWALAQEMGWTVVEMNASEARNRGAIEQVAGRASLTNAFSDDGTYRAARSGGRALILLDEADCLSGRASEDRASPRAAPSFREFLRTRYGTLEALAEAWGLGREKAPPAFAQWDSVPATGGRGAWTRLAPAQRDLADWREMGESDDLTDRGGLGAIAQLVRTTRQPVILTVNDPKPLTRYSPVFGQRVRRIRFGPVADDALRKLLRATVLEERLDVATPALDVIVRRSRGDLRAALNDLDAIAPLKAGPEQMAVLGARDLTSEIERFTVESLAHPHYVRSSEVQAKLDVSPDDILPWIEENAPSAARDAVHRYAALVVVARADVCLFRARRYRHWGLWSYATELMTGGVSVALARPDDAAEPFASFPQALGAMGRSKASRAQRKAVLVRLSPVLHLSVRKSIEAELPFLLRIFDPARPDFSAKAPRGIRAALIRAGKLGPEEVGYLMHREPDAASVREEIEKAEYRPPATDSAEETVPPRRKTTAKTPPVESTPPAETPAPKRPGRTRQRELGQF